MRSVSGKRGVLTGIALLVLLLAGAVVAQEIIHFFTQSDSDQSTAVFYYDTPTPGPTPDYYPLTAEEAAKTTDFPVLLPSHIPDAYHFAGASYAPETHGVILNYTCRTPWGFVISEQQVSEEKVTALSESVGASAVIDDVQIGDVIGQYVRGAWVPQGSWNLSDFDQIAAGTAISRETLWDNDSEFQQMAWYTNGIWYQIQTSGYIGGPDHTNSGTCGLQKADYVAIANGLVEAGK